MKGDVSIRDSFKKKNVSQRGLRSHRPHGTRAGLKKPKATKRSDLRTISLTADTAKIVAGILRTIERKIEDLLGEDRFGFKGGRGTGDASGI